MRKFKKESNVRSPYYAGFSESCSAAHHELAPVMGRIYDNDKGHLERIRSALRSMKSNAKCNYADFSTVGRRTFDPDNCTPAPQLDLLSRNINRSEFILKDLLSRANIRSKVRVGKAVGIDPDEGKVCIKPNWFQTVHRRGVSSGGTKLTQWVALRADAPEVHSFNTPDGESICELTSHKIIALVKKGKHQPEIKEGTVCQIKFSKALPIFLINDTWHSRSNSATSWSTNYRFLSFTKDPKTAVRAKLNKLVESACKSKLKYLIATCSTRIMYDNYQIIRKLLKRPFEVDELPFVADLIIRESEPFVAMTRAAHLAKRPRGDYCSRIK